MKRTLKALMVLAAFAGFASAANAATVVLTSNAGSYSPGDTITLTATVSTTGGEAASLALYGQIAYTATNRVTPIGGTLVQTAFAPGWTPGALVCTTVFCRAFSQTNAAAVVAAPTVGFVIATQQYKVTYVNAATVTTAFNWTTTPVSQRLNFYGITSAPGVTITIVPEPTTVAMLGLGLLGLGLAGRRRA